MGDRNIMSRNAAQPGVRQVVVGADEGAGLECQSTDERVAQRVRVVVKGFAVLDGDGGAGVEGICETRLPK